MIALLLALTVMTAAAGAMADSIFDTLGTLFGKVADEVGHVAGNAADWVQDGAEDVLNRVQDGAEDVLDWVQESADGVWKQTKGIAGGLLQKVRKTSGEALQSVQNGAGDAVDWVRSIAGKAMNWGQDTADDTIAWARTNAMDVLNTLNDKTDGAVGQLLTRFGIDLGGGKDSEKYVTLAAAQGLTPEKAKALWKNFRAYTKVYGIEDDVALQLLSIYTVSMLSGSNQPGPDVTDGQLFDGAVAWVRAMGINDAESASLVSERLSLFVELN